MTHLEILQLYALPVVVGASLVEALVLHWRKPGTFDWHEAWLSLVDLAGRKLLVFLPLSLAAPVFAFAWEHRLQTIVLNSWLLGLCLFIGQEFCYYWKSVV